MPPIVIVPEPAYESSKVIGEITQMQLPDGSGDLLACLDKVDELLKLEPEVSRKEVYIISDFQRTTWSAASAAEIARIKAVLKKIDESGSLVLIDVGQNDAGNVAVDGLRVARPLCDHRAPGAVQGHTAEFQLRASDRPAARVAGRRQTRRAACRRSECGGRGRREFLGTIGVPGERRVMARLQKDALPVDDQRWVVVPVKERIRCLCVNGGNSGRLPGKATDYLELALAPAGPAAARRPGSSLPGSLPWKRRTRSQPDRTDRDR